jgi:hypothetical protein
MAFNGTGSNVTSLNANNISSGTVPTARLGSGTADSSTYLRGDQTYAAIPASLPGLGGQVFTSSGTFTVPAGVTRAKVTVAGGGGSGGNARGNFQPSPRGGFTTPAYGGGGGGGGVAIKFVTGLTPGGTVSVTVGGASGTSSFGAFVSATGGGTSATAQGSPNTALAYTTGGAGGTGSGGDINISGGAGRNATPNNGEGAASGSLAGGGIGPPPIQIICGIPQLAPTQAGGILGGVAGGGAGTTQANGGAATGISNGGGGACSITNGVTTTGGAGSNGIVIVEF